MSQSPNIISQNTDGSALLNDLTMAFAATSSAYRGATDPANDNTIQVDSGFLWWNTGPTDSGLPELWVRTTSGWLALIAEDGTPALGFGAVGPSALQAVLDSFYPIAGGVEFDAHVEVAAGAGPPTTSRQLTTKDYVDALNHVAPVRFYVRGTAVVQNNVAAVLIEGTCHTVRIVLHATSAPTGSDLIINVVRVRGTSSPTEVSRSVTLTAAGYAVDAAVTQLDFLSGDRIRLDIVQVGSTLPGGNDLLVTVELEP